MVEKTNIDMICIIYINTHKCIYIYIFLFTIIHICVLFEESCLNTVGREGLLPQHQFHGCRCSHPKKALLR